MLTDDRVSRHHLGVRESAGRFLVRDLGSKNGTLYEGSLVTEVRVGPGATMTLGDGVFVGQGTVVEAQERLDVGAIDAIGRINANECVLCLRCQVIMNDGTQCPVLKRRARAEGATP